MDKVLEYRSLRKLISTYLDPLPSLVNPGTGRIHTTFNQALTATGRLSSVRPNLQNIPIRTERGQKIRMAFVPSSDDGYILSADYSQIELRIMAELSGDNNRKFSAWKRHSYRYCRCHISCFTRRGDKGASQTSKVANFGIIYSISSFGLPKDSGFPATRQRISLPNISIPTREYDAIWTNVSLMRAKRICFHHFRPQTLFADITSRNHVVRGLAERNAINTPVQGSAADIIKLSMINVFRRMKAEGLKSKMVLQVHDELVFDVIPSELNRLCDIVKQEMESVVQLSIPLTTECSYGKNWLEAQ